MTPITLSALRSLYDGAFRTYRDQDWAVKWRSGYAEQVRAVQDANWETWRDPAFQERLWDSNAVSSIGPGQSVTLVAAYGDEALARMLFEARDSLDGLTPEDRGAALQNLYDTVLKHVYLIYTPRRPKARLARLLAAMFPDDMTCLMDASRTWGIQRLLSAAQLPGDFVAQNPIIRERLREALGKPASIEEKVDQAIFAWFLWQELVDKPDEGAVAIEPARRAASAVPPFSLLPASAQRRSLTCVKDNVSLLTAMVREAEQGISREDLIGVILTEATQLNASSAGNIISQAMGGLGLIRLDGNAYRPTERGQEMLTANVPAHVLRGPLIGRVFGMGHLLLMVRDVPGQLRPIDAARRLQDLVPTWTSTQPGSYIYAWAKIAGLIQLDDNPGGGRLVITDDGEEYTAALPDNFETRWRIEPTEDDEPIAQGSTGTENKTPPASPATAQVLTYGIKDIVADGCFLPPTAIAGAVELLRRKKNLILQGPPGTGKTWLAKRLGYALIGAQDPDQLTAVQFQPSLSYEDFVRGMAAGRCRRFETGGRRIPRCRIRGTG